MKISENIKDAAIYVGTYHKYNCGSLYGRWMKLADYADKEEFLQACYELHKDEEDCELMFQDWEYIPEGMCGESWVSEDVDDYETIEELKDEAEDKFVGHYEDEEEIGYAMIDLLGIDSKTWEVVEPYFDMEKFGHSFTYDWYEEDGYYYDTNR